MLFDKEEWKIVQDEGQKTYLGVVDNTVEVSPCPHKPYSVYVIPPTPLFPYMAEVLKLTPDRLDDSPMAFFLTKDPSGVWVFGMDQECGEYGVSFDLWTYSKLPSWAER